MSQQRSLSRREFIGVAAGGAGVLALARANGIATVLAPRPSDALLASITEGSITFVRATDQALVTMRFVNLALDASGATLEAIDAGAPCAVVFDVGAQHAAEQGVDVAGGEPIPTASQARRLRGAGSSHVVVAVEPGLAFTVASLFDLADRSLVVDPRADLGAGPAPADVTAIEVPADVVLSPGSGGGALAEAAPITRASVTELFRLRLGPSATGPTVDAALDAPLELRALDGGDAPDGFSRPLDQTLRQQLVEATTDTSSLLYPDNEPLLATKLWLGLHGAFADLAGAWAGSGALAAYAETVRSGRAVTVTVTERGFLAPFGHPASVVATAERTFATASDGTAVAVLVLDETLNIGDPTISYPLAFMPHDGRGLPFTSVHVAVPGGASGRAVVEWTDEDGVDQSIGVDRLWQVADGDDQPLVLDHSAIDRAGNEVAFSTGAYFVPADRAFSLAPAGPLGKLVDLFNDNGADALAARTITLGGQPIAFADEDTPGSGVTTKATDEMRLRLVRPEAGVTMGDLQTAGQPAFFLRMGVATVTDPTFDALAATAAPSAAVEVTLDQRWLDDGNGPGNAGNVFLRLSTPANLAFGGGGEGLLAPSINVDVFGQDLGISIDLEALLGEWDPLAALGDATLLGLIDLASIVAPVEVDLGGGSLAVPGIPGLSIEVDPPPPAPPTEVCVSFLWEPTLTSQSVLGHRVFVVTDDFDDEGIDNTFGAPTSATFRAGTCIALDASGTELGAELEVTLANVALLLPPGLPALAVLLEKVSFRVPDDGTPLLDVDIAGYQFTGSLSFLEPFRELLAGDSAGANVSFETEGIDVDLDFRVPDVGLGVVRLSDISVGLSLFVPDPEHTDDPFTVSFSIGTMNNPVAIGVWFFKGTASFEVDLQPHPIGVARFAASLGMGAEIAAGGFGVSGSLSMEIAASVEYEATPDGGGDITVGGMFKLHGEITAFLVISVGLEASLHLVYVVDTERLRANGQIVGWVTVLGIHKEWRVQARETFDMSSDASRRRVDAGATGATATAGGSFGDVYSNAAWQTYCNAFA